MEVWFEAGSRPEPDAMLIEPSVCQAEQAVAGVVMEARNAQSSPEADMGLAEGGAACVAAQPWLLPTHSAAAWHATAERELERTEGSWQPSDSPSSATECTPRHAGDSIQPAEALPADVSLTPFEHASPVAEASTGVAEPCHNPEAAQAEHGMPASADSGADSLTRDQGAASLDEQMLQEARACSEAGHGMTDRCAGALAEQAGADGAPGLGAAPAETELAGEAGQLEPESSGAADPAAAATQLNAECGAGTVACSPAERLHLPEDAAEHDAEAPCQLQPHAGSSAAGSTPQEAEAGSRDAPLTQHASSDAAPQLAGNDEVWRLAKRLKLVDDAEGESDCEPRQGLIAAAYPADVQDGERTTLASAQPDPCGAFVEPAPAAETAAGAPERESPFAEQQGFLAAVCVQGLEPAPGGSAHGGSGQPCDGAAPGSASLEVSWMAGSEGPPLLLQPAQLPPQPSAPAAAASLTPLPLAPLLLPPRVAQPPPPPPLLSFLLASSARRSSALALQGRGGAAEAQRRAPQRHSGHPRRGEPAPADGPGPCPSPRPGAPLAARLSASAGHAAAGGHASDAAAAGADTPVSPSLEGRAGRRCGQPAASLIRRQHARGPALGGLLAEPGAPENPGVGLGCAPGEPALAPRPPARFRPLHWARLPCVRRVAARGSTFGRRRQPGSRWCHGPGARAGSRAVRWRWPALRGGHCGAAGAPLRLRGAPSALQRQHAAAARG